MKLSLLISMLGAMSSVIALTTPISSLQVFESNLGVRWYLSKESYFFRVCGNQPSDEVVRQIEADFPSYKVDSDVQPTATTLKVSFYTKNYHII